MTTHRESTGVLAPFRLKSFRLQWAGDLAASWAFEMEMLMLGWFVLVQSGSVLALAAFGALQYAGSLFSPLVGVLGDRVGYAKLFWQTRLFYGLLAAVIWLMALTDTLTYGWVLLAAGISGALRPSDMVMRYVVIAEHQPPAQLMGALGVARATFDSARIVGALLGTGAAAVVGLPIAYTVVVALYVISFSLTRAIPDAGVPRPGMPAGVPVQAHLASIGRDLLTAVGYVWQRPLLRVAFALAFLVNLLAFPFYLGLLPYAAKHVFALGQQGLGWLSASFALGCLLGSITLSLTAARWPAKHTMVWATLVWFGLGVVYALNSEWRVAVGLLVAIGFVSNMCLTPLAAVMLRGAEVTHRSRVMGLRMLAIWGLPIGLTAAGSLVSWLGFGATALAYAGVGLALSAAIMVRWRHVLQ